MVLGKWICFDSRLHTRAPNILCQMQDYTSMNLGIHPSASPIFKFINEKHYYCKHVNKLLKTGCMEFGKNKTVWP